MRVFGLTASKRFAVVTIAGAFAMLTAAPPANAATICVSKTDSSCFRSIQAAVDAAAPGDTVLVGTGTYNEMVTIDKAIKLTSTSGYAGTIVNASGLAHAIYLTGIASGHATISGITAQNALREGILVENSAHVTVSNNRVQFNDRSLDQSNPSNLVCPGTPFPFLNDDCGEGLHLMGVSYSTVSGNLVQSNAGGILLTDETGANDHNLVENNTVQNNLPDCGITLPSHPPCGAGSNDITGCIGGPEIGHPSFGVFDNTVSGNSSLRNGAAGVGIFGPTPGTAAYDNFVIGNTATQNAQGGIVMHSHAIGQDLNGNVIEDNQLFFNGGDPDSEGGSNPPKVGIVLFSDVTGGAAPLSGLAVSGNTIQSEDVDVFVGTSATDLTMSNNNLYPWGQGIGVKNAGTGTIDARRNYWGCSQGPGRSACSAPAGPDVLTTPFLRSPAK